MNRNKTAKNKSRVEGIVDRNRGIIGLRCSESKKFHVLVENLIPAEKWSVEDGLYLIAIDLEKLVYELLANCFQEVEIDETQVTEEDFINDKHQKVYIDSNELFSLLSLDDLKSIYKLLALRYHPDKDNGNEEKMKAINKIFDSIKK